MIPSACAATETFSRHTRPSPQRSSRPGTRFDSRLAEAVERAALALGRTAGARRPEGRRRPARARRLGRREVVVEQAGGGGPPPAVGEARGPQGPPAPPGGGGPFLVPPAHPLGRPCRP